MEQTTRATAHTHPEYGVLCTLANGEQMVVTVESASPESAIAQVQAHVRLFYGAGDAAGRWLASQNPRTITAVHEARLLSEWEDGE